MTVPAAFWLDGTTGCPRCGHAGRVMVNIDGGANYICSGCEWRFVMSAQAPTGTTNAALVAGATALSVASGGASFTNGMPLFIDTGTAAEVTKVNGTATATSVPVTPLLKAHNSGVAFGQLLVATPYGNAVGTAAVPNPPGWGY